MRILGSENNSQYITYREGNRKINGVHQTCLHLTLHDGKISPDRKNNVVAKASLSFQDLLDYIMNGNESKETDQITTDIAEKFIEKAVCDGCSNSCNCHEEDKKSECEDWKYYMEIANSMKGK